MEFKDGKVYLTAQEMRDTGFPEGLPVSHGCLKAIHTRILEEEAKKVASVVEDAYDVDPQTISKLAIASHAQNERQRIAGELRRELEVQEFVASMDTELGLDNEGPSLG